MLLQPTAANRTARVECIGHMSLVAYGVGKILERVFYILIVRLYYLFPRPCIPRSLKPRTMKNKTNILHPAQLASPKSRLSIFHLVSMFHVDLAHINAVGAIFSRSPLRLGIAAADPSELY